MDYTPYSSSMDCRRSDPAKPIVLSFPVTSRARHRRQTRLCNPLLPVHPFAEDFMSALRPDNTQDPQLASLLGNLGELIRDARQKVLRAVDTVQVQTCWQIGRHIVEFEQEGARRAAYGKRLLPTLAKVLTTDFGKGFDERNLRYMRDFYQTFPIWNAVRSELSWTHYRRLLRVDNEHARHWYMNESAILNWSSRALERQINTLYYERLLTSRDRPAVEHEAATNIQNMKAHPRDFIRDPVILEFLGIPNAGLIQETNLEQALINQLQAFLLELGKGFAFIARQQRISTDSKDFYIDLVFYNYLLKCFVIFDLKRGELTHQDVGQMDMYVRMYDDLKRGAEDGPTVGIISAHKKTSQWCVTRCWKATNNCSPASTSWCCPAKRSCVRNWIGNGQQLKSDCSIRKPDKHRWIVHKRREDYRWQLTAKVRSR
jgi:predicted nuclease of restriction endonuclease-like (RecB) superfamily